MVREWRTITLNDVCVYTSSLLRAASLMRARFSADAFRARRRRGHTLYHLESEHLKFYALGASLCSWPWQCEFECLQDEEQCPSPPLC